MNSNENKQENKQEKGNADILIVLDESGSMSSCMTEVIQSLDKFIADQQEVAGLISIYKFNTRVSVPIKDIKLSEITPFTNEPPVSLRVFDEPHVSRRVFDEPHMGEAPDETIDDDEKTYEIIESEKDSPKHSPKHSLNYIPCGMTALFDAIGTAVSDKLNTDRNKNVNLMIITDGQDNSSHEHTVTTIRSLIERIRTDEYNWTVHFLGKDIDAFTEGSRLSIPKQCCIRIGNDDGECSVQNVLRNVSACVSANRYSSYSQNP